MRYPAHAIVIDNYQEFRDDLRACANKEFGFAIFLGRTGVGKSETVREIFRPDLVFDGLPTAWQMFQDIYHERPRRIVLDDVSAKFFRDPTCQSFLKALTETTPVKTLRWPTASAAKAGLDPSFQITTRVILLANEWRTINEHIRAIEGRANIFVFDPTPTELHHEVGRRGWFHDQEIFDFIWSLRRFITRPDMRAYRRIAEHKRAGRPWHKRALEMLVGDRRMQVIATLLDDPRFRSNNTRAEAFVRMGFGVRSTFYELLKEFKWYEAVSPDTEPPKLRSANATRAGTQEANSLGNREVSLELSSESEAKSGVPELTSVTERANENRI